MGRLAILGGRPVREKPFPTWPDAGDREKEYLQRVIDSNGWGVFRGNLTFELAERFAAYHGAAYGIACSSGTAGLQVQLQSLGVGRGDEVITTAFTCISTITAIVNVGAIPVLADVDGDTYCLDPAQVARKITCRTRAIVAVHLYNSLCDMHELARMAEENGLSLIEDAAQVPGSFYAGRGVGTIGTSGSFSFQESKVMTSGEGGMIITNNRELAELANSYINCGRTRPTDRTARQVMGANYRMTDFQAAVLLGQMEALPDRTAKREESSLYLNSQLQRLAGIRTIPRRPEVTRQACYYYVFAIRPDVLPLSRLQFMAALEAEGIPTRNVFVPVYKDPLWHLNSYDTPEAWNYYREHPISGNDYPVSERAAFQEAIAIWHPFLLLGRSDLDELVLAVEKVVSNADAISAIPVRKV